MTDRPDPKDQAYAIAKLQASVDGAFDDQLMRSWFDAAWDLCAAMVGFVHPPFQVAERITVRADGSFRLSYQPSSEVKIYSGATLILVMP